LVEAQAFEQAEGECLADEKARACWREREAVRRAELDYDYVQCFAERVRELFPGCPAGRETAIAEHACLNYSGRIDRSAAGENLDEEAARLAMVAHIRHTQTRYDELLARGSEM
jgi:hypothetical protein